MSDQKQHSSYFKPELIVGTIVGSSNRPIPGAAADSRMLADFVPSDNHSYGYQFPVALPPGFARRYRVGQFAVASYALGSPQLGFILGHSFNNDAYASSPNYSDMFPLTQLQGPQEWSGTSDGNIIPNVDDLAFYHDETGGFWRFRSVSGSSPTTPGPLGGPGIAELKMRSGVVLAFKEYPLDNPPPPPVQPPGQSPPAPLAPSQRAKLTVKMPAGTEILYDEPQVGVATLSVTIPNENGDTTLMIDQSGNITLSATGNITIDAPEQTVQVNVQGGGDAETGAVALGDLEANLSATENAATRFTDLDSTVRNQVTQIVGNGIIQLVTAIRNNGGDFGSLTPDALLGALAGGFPGADFFALLPSLHSITIPACSQTVLVK